METIMETIFMETIFMLHGNNHVILQCFLIIMFLDNFSAILKDVVVQQGLHLRAMHGGEWEAEELFDVPSRTTEPIAASTQYFP
jgi:hypothetical protein